eukprot:scaffold71725_cov84-Phaeocystis_antarctica.AAC.2
MHTKSRVPRLSEVRQRLQSGQVGGSSCAWRTRMQKGQCGDKSEESSRASPIVPWKLDGGQQLLC